MWALRRAVNPLRGSQGYCLGSSRACCAKLVTSTDAVLQQGSENGHFGRFAHSGFLLSSKRFYQQSSSNVQFSMRSRSLSSQAGAESSEDEDNLEDGFSELETSPSSETIQGKNIEENDELVSEPELSDDDVDIAEDALDKPSPNELELSEVEPDAEDEAVLKKKTNYEFVKVILDSPRNGFDDAINQWIEKGNTLGRSEISLAMLNLRKRRMYGKALQFSEWLEANKHLDMAERDYASRLDLIFKVRGLHKAEKYIESIPESFKGEVIYRTLLANCVGAANMKKAEEVFNKMRDMEFKVTAFACNQLLLLYKRLDKKKIADVLLFMEKENIKPSLFTYRLLIDTKGQSHDITGMEQLLETMKEQGLEPDVLTQSMVARHYITGGLQKKAEGIVKSMEGTDLKESRGACRTLLPLYADLGLADDVLRVWKMCESNPRLEECLAAIEAWGKLGKIEEAEAVFKKMSETWKKLSARNYTSLLKVYASNKLLVKGKKLATQMVESGCHVGPVTWDALVRLYVESGEVEKADQVLQKAITDHKFKPLFNSLMMIMDQYAKKGDVHNAEKTFQRLRHFGYVGRARQYQALMQAYANAKVPAYGFRDRMKADNIFPNKALATLLAQTDPFKKPSMSAIL